MGKEGREEGVVNTCVCFGEEGGGRRGGDATEGGREGGRRWRGRRGVFVAGVWRVVILASRAGIPGNVGRAAAGTSRSFSRCNCSIV